jgi:dTDP-L-rhamnose 4-epimerase
MKILVTGGAGFVGSHTVDRLLADGHEVRVFDNLDAQVHGERATSARNLAGHLRTKAIDYRQGDVRDGSALRRALRGMEAVLHLAAAVGVAQSMYRPIYYAEANTVGTATLLETLANEPTGVGRLVVASSMTLYGEGAYRCPACGPQVGVTRPVEQLAAHRWEVECPVCSAPMEPRPTPETKPSECTSIYAITKKSQEEMALCFGQAHRLPVVALRYFNIYGSRQSLDNPYAGVGAIFVSRILNNHAPLVFEDGQQSRDFTHVHDIARANVLALTSDRVNGQALNVGTGRPTTVLGLAEALVRLLGRDLPPRVMQQFRAGDTRHCIADTTRLRELTGFVSEVTLDEGLGDLIAWSATESPVDAVEQSLAELQSKGMIG